MENHGRERLFRKADQTDQGDDGWNAFLQNTNLTMVCIVPTCGMMQTSGHRMRKLPRHPELAHRWLQAIEIGCRQQNIPWVRENWISAEICDGHFDGDNPLYASGGYLEPSRFYNSSGEALSVTSCRLCLQFYQHNEVTDYTDYMTLRSPELFSLGSINKLIAPSKNLSKFICLECVAKLDILESVLLFFDHSYKCFESLEASLNLMNHDSNLKSEKRNGITEGSLVEEDRQLELELSEVMIKDEIPDDETNNFLQKSGIASDVTIIKAECVPSVESASRFKNYGAKVKKKPTTEVISCSECNQCFATKYNLKRHRWFKHSASKKPSRLLMFECELCKTKHMRLSELDSHIKHDHGGEEYPYLSCKDCTKTFSCRTKLTRHSLCHTDTGKNRCDICNKLFISRCNMLMHRRHHNKEWNHECEICHKKYTTKEILKYHQKKHTEELNYECLYCDKKFILKRRLDYHTAMHHMDRSFKCDLCSKSFITENRLKIHHKTHIDPLPTEERISFECNECGKKFSTKYQMKIHQAHVHSTERPFACQICGKRFTTNKYLRQHMVLHNNERNFECDICKETFKTKSVLKIHMERHSDEPKFSCNLCGKAMKTKSSLLKHIKRHTNEREFECVDCGKKFKTKQCLGNHRRVTCRPVSAFQL
ncbi:oocyte zinc finger protein XlCOF6-like [Uranotaenia lowii]|uniref:oocyte zinc finger protein XlCOF6-like n=1 Tax=Uranotaenia lowii TaxID=190385 RepID=UPI002478DAF2|nr:oocyte zinc finger protein XlCOF6-like [Uranotaenia lowii]